MGPRRARVAGRISRECSWDRRPLGWLLETTSLQEGKSGRRDTSFRKAPVPGAGREASGPQEKFGRRILKSTIGRSTLAGAFHLLGESQRIPGGVQPKRTTMFREIAVIAPGAMGSAIARRLLEHDVRVTTLLDGRSRESRERAEAAGMIGIEPARIADADVVLSIVPPAQALPLAETIALLLRQSDRKPIFVDCNAVSVGTVEQIAGVIASSGIPFVDAAIIGAPPVTGGTGPTLYVSGQPASDLDALNRAGLQTVVMEGPVGSASALKMSYAGITKGLIGIAAAMILAAERGGATQALHKELAASQSQLLQRLGKSLPDMYPKAYRWVAEMREIAAFAGDDPATARIYEALADFYESLAEDQDGPRAKTRAIDGFLQQRG